MNAKSLYVVKKDNTVEEAVSLFDFFLKKMGLDSVLETLLGILKMLMQHLNSYAQIEYFSKLVKMTLDHIQIFLGKLSLGQVG